jgi:hypothetical protein
LRAAINQVVISRSAISTEEERRLAQQAEIFRPLTVDFLRHAEMVAGMRVPDIDESEARRVRDLDIAFDDRDAILGGIPLALLAPSWAKCKL